MGPAPDVDELGVWESEDTAGNVGDDVSCGSEGVALEVADDVGG